MKLSKKLLKLSKEHEKEGNKLHNSDNSRYYNLGQFRAYELSSEKVSELEKENEELKVIIENAMKTLLKLSFDIKSQIK